MNLFSKITLILYMFTLVAGCGGGSGGPAGEASSVANNTFKVSTSASVGGQISASQAIIKSGSTAQFTLTPDLNYVIDAVSGCNGTLNTSQYITGPVSGDCMVSASFLYVNQAPVISLIPQQFVDEFAEVTLQADASDDDGQIESYLWTQTSGVSVIIDDATRAFIRFTLPPIIRDESITFSVTVSDDLGAQTTQTAVVQAKHTNTPPSVSAQSDITISENTSLLLSATALDAEGEISKYTWTQVEGENLVVSGSNTSTLRVDIPEINEQQQVVFQIVVSDFTGATASDKVIVTIINEVQIPENPVLVGVSALSTNSINVEWLDGTSTTLLGDLPANSQLTYSVHVSEQSDFLPNATNSKLQTSAQNGAQSSDKINAQITGLLANTTYYVIIAAHNEDNNSSFSNQLSVSTMTTAPVFNTEQVFRNIDNVEVSANSLRYTLTEQNSTPQIGDIIMSANQNGILRKVIGVTLNGNIVEVQTEPAALNEIYNDVDINTSIKIVDTPEQSASANNKSLSVASSSSDFKRHTASTTNTAFSMQTAQTTQTVKDKHLLLQGPKRVTFTPGLSNSFNISASLINDANNNFEVSGLTLLGITHNTLESDATVTNYGASSSIISSEQTGKELQLVWEPTQGHVDSKTAQPFIATFQAKVLEKNCVAACIRSSALLHVKIHMGETLLRPASAIEFTKAGDITITGKGQYSFEPTLNVAAKIEAAVLTSAHAKVSGFLDIQLDLGVLADASGNVNGSTEFLSKTFSKVLIVGGAPVIIHGDFILSGEYSAQALGQLNVEQALDISYYFEAGFEYQQSNWSPVYEGTPVLKYQLKDGASSQVSTTLSLIPEIKLRFYEFNAGHIKFAPTIYNNVGLEGVFAGRENLGSNSGEAADYRFTSLGADIGSNLQLNANFEAFDKSVAPWPETAADGFFNVEALAKTSVYALPIISVQDETSQSAASTSNSCEIVARANITALISAFSAQVNANDWESQSASWSVSSPNSPSEKIDNARVTNEAISSKVRAQATTFSKYTLRVSGFSKTGAWANQYQDITFDFTDSNNDFLPDYWADTYTLNSASADTDNDGINNADEFQHCTFPNKQDSDNDGMPDGWEVANSLNPVANDANNDGDGDNRSNLQEFLDNSDPLVEDINEPPVVWAGQNQTVDELTSVILLATASDGGTINSQSWSQISGPLVGLVNSEALQSSFTAPSVDEITMLGFEFEAIDNSGAASTSQVQITINPINAIPTAVAGTDLLVSSGDTVALDASASFDVDGNIVSYEWTVLNGQTLFLADPTAALTSFVAPAVVSLSTFEISLTVVDNQGASSASVVKISVSPNADLDALSSIPLAQLNDTVVVIRDVDETGLHATLALFLASTEASVYIATQQRNAANEIDTIITEAALIWRVQDTNLVIESSAFGTRTLNFDDSTIDVSENIVSLAEDIGRGITQSAVISELYTQKSLITENLKGFAFTILQNDKNTLIDFVTDTRAFIYAHGSPDFESVEWAYTANEQGKQLTLAIDPQAPIAGIYDSFNTFDSISNLKLIDISVLPSVDSPLSQVIFTDLKLKNCVQQAAQTNNWLSINEVTHLDCSSLSIASSQGLEQLTALTTLKLSGNLLLNINTSQYSQLRELDVSNNQLNSIDFSNNPLLTSAKLNNNNFSNATVAYLSSITWITDLRFDAVVVLPNGTDFVLLVTVESLSDFKIITDQSFDYDFNVDWGDGSETTSHTQDAVHNYAQAGSYEITITGTFPALKFCDDNSGCSSFRLDVLKWGGNKWLSMEGAFSGLAKLNILANDVPDLSRVENVSFMFYKTPNFNSDISNWNISKVTDMNFMFGFASSFNGDISRWDTGEVTNMGGLFYSATSFNGDISRWDTRSVTRMHSLFAAASSFNSDISQWNTASVTHMATMFLGATNFNGNVSLWDVSGVSNMEKMFYNATSMSGNLSNWQVATGVRHNNFTHADSFLVEPIWKD